MDINALFTRISPESQARQAGREHYAEAAGKAANTKNYQRAADTALVNMQGVNYSAQGGESVATARPMLAMPAPAAAQAKQGGEDKFTLLMASLISLLGEVSIDSLRTRMESLKASAKSTSESNKALSEKYQNAAAEFEAGVSSASNAESKHEAAKAHADKAKNELTSAEKNLAQARESAPENKKAREVKNQAQAKVQIAEQQLAKATAQQKEAVSTAANLEKKAELQHQQSTANVENARNELTRAKGNLDQTTAGTPEHKQALQVQAKAKATLLAAEEQLGKSQAQLQGAPLAAANLIKKADADFKAAGNDLQNARNELASAEKALAQINPKNPEYTQALVARDAAQAKVVTAKELLSKAAATNQAAIQSAAELGKKAEALAQQLPSIGTTGKPVFTDVTVQLNAAATMVLLMTSFAELMGESAENKIDSDQELFRTMQTARQAYMEQKSEEYLEEVRKSEAASKTMGCIGKVLGAILTVVSVVGAAFTGGASLALAAVGIALMMADMLVKEITGVSFMEQAMKPLMDNVLGPMIKAIGKGITDMLTKMGVDEKSAQMAGMIMGAIVGALAMVAVLAVVAVVGKSAAGRVAGAMANMFGKMVSKMAPQMLKQAARAVSKGFTNTMTKARGGLGLQSDAASLGKYSARLGGTVAGVEAGGVSAQSAMGIKSGIHQRNAAEKMAEVKLAMIISEVLKQYMSEMVQVFDKVMSVKDEAIKKAFALQDNMNSTSLSMARNI